MDYQLASTVYKNTTMKLYLLLAFFLVAIFSTAECGKKKPACEEGQFKKILCHPCICTDGKYVCKHYYICEPGEEPRCCPRSSFKIECNSCRCDNKGMKAACTKRGCPEDDVCDL